MRNATRFAFNNSIHSFKSGVSFIIFPVDDFEEDLHTLVGAEGLVVGAVGGFGLFEGIEFLHDLFHGDSASVVLRGRIRYDKGRV